MDKIIERLYQIELDADESLNTIDDKKLALKNKYDNLHEEYQEKAEEKFDHQTSLIKEEYEKEKDNQFEKIEDEFEVHSKQIHKIFNHEQEHYVERFMNSVKKLGAIDDEWLYCYYNEGSSDEKSFAIERIYSK